MFTPGATLAGYERVEIFPNVLGSVFFYALRREKGNHFEYGVGFESREGLTLVHQKIALVHHFYVNEEISKIHSFGVHIPPGRVQDILLMSGQPSTVMGLTTDDRNAMASCLVRLDDAQLWVA